MAADPRLVLEELNQRERGIFRGACRMAMAADVLAPWHQRFHVLNAQNRRGLFVLDMAPMVDGEARYVVEVTPLGIEVADLMGIPRPGIQLPSPPPPVEDWWDLP